MKQLGGKMARGDVQQPLHAIREEGMIVIGKNASPNENNNRKTAGHSRLPG